MVNAFAEKVPDYKHGPTKAEIKKTIKNFQPYCKQINELIASVEKVDVTMYGKFPKPISPKK